MTRTEKPYTFGKANGVYEIRVLLPFATKGEVGLFKKGDELVVEVGTLRRHIGLPRSMAMLSPAEQGWKRTSYSGNEGGAMNEHNRTTAKAASRRSERFTNGAHATGVMDFIRDRLGVSPEVRQHLSNSRIEFLKAIREVINEKIEHLSKRPSRGPGFQSSRIAAE